MSKVCGYRDWFENCRPEESLGTPHEFIAAKFPVKFEWHDNYDAYTWAPTREGEE